jgi:hypothetical protein
MLSMYFLQIIFSIFIYIRTQEIKLLGIEPMSGPEYGETRVLVRMKDFQTDLKDDYPNPKVINNNPVSLR